jgi:AcrR family transcriptional regulator
MNAARQAWEKTMLSKRTRGEVRNVKLQKVAADLFLKRGYEGVTIDKIVEVAGGSKSTVYSEFGGKCGLFIRSIESLCRESNEPLARIDYTGLNLKQSLKKLSFHILKLVTAKRSVELHRLAIGEAARHGTHTARQEQPPSYSPCWKLIGVSSERAGYR